MKHASLLLTIFFLSFYSSLFSQIALWQAGDGNHEGYRIPSLITTQKGTVLAFCEGRNGGGDAGDINLVIRRSEDNGKSWDTEQTIWDDGLNTCGNPCPVVDESTGRIWLFMTWNLGTDKEKMIIQKKSEDVRRPFVCYSDDDGKTWSDPVDLGTSCRDSEWGWYATGPGIGIQLKNGPNKGRMIIPANHSYDDPEGKLHGPHGYGAHVLISDDHGESWRKSASIRPGCNESQVAELSDGTLIMNMRSYNGQYSRAISYSKDGGDTWTDIEHDYQLVESKCQASILNYGTFKGQNLFLFSNPAVPKGRTHMTIQSSIDNCEKWKQSTLIHAGPSAYSCLTRLANGKVAILYEGGEQSPYEKILFQVLDVKDLVGK